MKPRPPSRPAAPPVDRAPAAPAGVVDFDTLLDRGIELFNRQQFFEAHDVWEDAWRASSGDRAMFLQGLIQIAAGFVKWQRGHYRGMAALLEKGVEKLERVGARFEGVEVEGLLEGIGVWRTTAPSGAAQQSADPRPGRPPGITREA